MCMRTTCQQVQPTIQHPCECICSPYHRADSHKEVSESNVFLFHLDAIGAHFVADGEVRSLRIPPDCLVEEFCHAVLVGLLGFPSRLIGCRHQLEEICPASILLYFYLFQAFHWIDHSFVARSKTELFNHVAGVLMEAVLPCLSKGKHGVLLHQEAQCSCDPSHFDFSTKSASTSMWMHGCAHVWSDSSTAVVQETPFQPTICAVQNFSCPFGRTHDQQVTWHGQHGHVQVHVKLVLAFVEDVHLVHDTSAEVLHQLRDEQQCGHRHSSHRQHPSHRRLLRQAGHRSSIGAHARQ
mmetsp:Transcript_9125/g.55495  ORF Transcript_9125/g.55495 Transcript_9125/m.55495 type:complete len:295 (-) Transcript_9125:110-994(-)